MKKLEVKTVIWDVDGVIFSPKASFELFCQWCMRFGKEINYDPNNLLDFNEWRKNLQVDWKANYRRAGFDEQELIELEELKKSTGRIYPLNKGIRRTIANLNKKGKTQVIVSSNLRRIIKNNLDGLDGFIEFIIDSTDVKKEKPSPEGLLLALERTNTLPDEAVYIGDMATDIIASYGAGIKCIAYLGGLHPKEKLIAMGKRYGNCHAFISSIKEVEKYII